MWQPRFEISIRLANSLIRIEAAREAVAWLPITPSVLASLRESARLFSTHYSTMIEGNRLTQVEVGEVLGKVAHFPGRERDEHEVLGYFTALEAVEKMASEPKPLIQKEIRTIHALVMAGGAKKQAQSPYRDGQNVIRDSRSGGIVYMPPEAGDVPQLMGDLVEWLNRSEKDALPCPLRAALAHYQFATIHPYYDGNGRTARLLTTLVLHRGGYDLKGLYSLEEYYARNLGAYYAALSLGPSHNYYFGRAEADLTGWLEYFCEGMAHSFEAVKRTAQDAAKGGHADHSQALRRLDPRQRRALELFRERATITSREIEQLFGISPRTARGLLRAWSETGFLDVANPSKKSRTYGLSAEIKGLFDG